MLLKQNNIIESPLNYTGGKYKLLSSILPFFKKADIFLDLFCGGANVGINVCADKIILNDLNFELIELLKTIQIRDDFYFLVLEIIEKYNLSKSYKYGFEYYQTTGTKGLFEYNREKYLKLRKDFNQNKTLSHYRCAMLYVLIVYSFNNQIRFNKKGEYNLPVGKRDFNEKLQIKLKKFIHKLKSKNFEILNYDFRKIDTSKLTKNSFVYIDPPYLITCATYNELNKWNQKDEEELLDFIDNLDKRKIKFALSNVLENKNKENEILKNWIFKNCNKYKVINLNHNYNNSNYKIKNKNSKTEEILVINY